MATTASSGHGQPVIRVIDCHIARVVREDAGPDAGPDAAADASRMRRLEFLLLRRAAGRIYAGTWRMVGGKIEAGETAWQTCIRELQEETGLVPDRLLCVPYVNQFYEWKHDRINAIPVFVALVEGDPRLDGEHDAFEWLSAAQACERLPWPGQKEGLIAAEALLLRNDSLQEFMEIPLRGGEARA